MSFKLTYATMFNPPADVHRRFDAALAEVNRSLGATHALYINGEDRDSARHDTRRSPIDQRRVLGTFHSPVSLMRTMRWRPRKLPFQAGAQYRWSSVCACSSGSQRWSKNAFITLLQL